MFQLSGIHYKGKERAGFRVLGFRAFRAEAAGSLFKPRFEASELGEEVW